MSQTVLCSFVSYLAKSGLACSTIKTYVSAVRFQQIALGHAELRSSGMPKYDLVQRGIRREKSGEVARPSRLPITPTVLRQLRSYWSTEVQSYDLALVWAICCTAFFGFFRLGELIEQSPTGPKGLSIADIAVDDVSNPKLLRIHLRRSKTDQFGAGVHIFLGATGCAICPVDAMLVFLSQRGPAEGPLFCRQGGAPVTRDWFVSELRRGLDRCGTEHRRYAGHSFRIRAATTAAERGIEDSTHHTDAG